ncbi:MAG: CHAP domain-containing protein [Candidatus Saccharimonas sp.]|nr:CHAP domain-containing protein [Candidatus Saccharimonas sp.]
MMKQRSATPVQRPRIKGLATKSIVVATAVLMILAAPLSITQRVHADSYDDQMQAINNQIRQYQSRADELGKQAQTLQVELDRLTNEKNAIQAQINLSQAQYDKLQKQITDTEKKISDNKDALGETIANMYVDNSITPLEMLASSKSIGDYVDQQEYRASIRDTLNTTIEEIKALKIKLEKDKADVQVVLDRQKAQQASLAAKEAQQAQLVQQTRNDEAAFQGLVSQNQSQLQSIAAQQRAYYDSLRQSSGGGDSGVIGNFSYSNWSGNSGCGSGGYPYCGYQDSYSDPWGLYNRECVSYVAWALSERFGKYVGNFSGNGNAYEWVWSAPRYSGAVRTYDPQPGDAVILPIVPGLAPVGHAMIVESVSGSTVRVSQYNFYGTGEYSTMNIATSGVVFLRFQNK